MAREEGTEDPAATPQEEVDEVPDLNPPKKNKKGAVAKEATRKIATMSTSKVPDNPPQPREAHPIAQDGWEGLLMDLGQPHGKGANNPEERTDTTSNTRAQNKRGWPGSADDGPAPSGTQGATPAQEAFRAWKVQDTLIKTAERAMKAKAEGDMTMANRLYDIGAGLGRALPRANPATAIPTGAGTVHSPLIIEGLRVPVPITGNTQITEKIEVVQPMGKAKPSKTASATGSLICNNLAVPTSVDVGLTPFFQKNLEELKGPLPLTIFNEEWQDKAIMHWSEKKPKAEAAGTDVFCYSGYPYPSKYCQTLWNSHAGLYTGA
ncbi:hypothetical protein PTTG_10336 [Puccinia triticina 1-1 BBBD Race 1]|uniref:Uncharacterized protein n=1 Tax=Puccinia triticina (isolate 1-1 / race 1 (BBBD)) TaxID=630390 RepID=A0A0C4FAU3_PUCT1|nr:hypothetical protein PTTG_10336 [Puccinia triticina 1-1 BBBD Race 1]